MANLRTQCVVPGCTARKTHPEWRAYWCEEHFDKQRLSYAEYKNYGGDYLKNLEEIEPCLPSIWYSRVKCYLTDNTEMFNLEIVKLRREHTRIYYNGHWDYGHLEMEQYLLRQLRLRKEEHIILTETSVPFPYQIYYLWINAWTSTHTDEEYNFFCGSLGLEAPLRYCRPDRRPTYLEDFELIAQHDESYRRDPELIREQLEFEEFYARTSGLDSSFSEPNSIVNFDPESLIPLTW